MFQFIILITNLLKLTIKPIFIIHSSIIIINMLFIIVITNYLNFHLNTIIIDSMIIYFNYLKLLINYLFI